jgi:hypothetical protein
MQPKCVQLRLTTLLGKPSNLIRVLAMAYTRLTTQAVKTTSQLELRNVFAFAAKTDTRQIGTRGSRADFSVLAPPSQLHEFDTLHAQFP